MPSKKEAARRWKNRDTRSDYEREMSKISPEQMVGMAQEVAEKTGRTVEEVVEAMKDEAKFIIFLNENMPKLGALQPGDVVRPLSARDRRAYRGKEVVGEWLADHPQEAVVKEVILRRNAQPVMVRVEPVAPATGEYLFMDKFELERVEVENAA